MESDSTNNQILARTVLDAEIGSRIKSNKNYIGLIIGETGAGKSYAAVRIAEMLSPNFTSENIVFDVRSFIRRLKKLTLEKEGRGQFLIFDEAGSDLSARRSMSEKNVQMASVLEMLRFTLVNCLFTFPGSNSAFADIALARLAHGYIYAIPIPRDTCPPWQRDKTQIRAYHVNQAIAPSSRTESQDFRTSLPVVSVVVRNRRTGEIWEKRCKIGNIYLQKANQSTLDTYESMKRDYFSATLDAAEAALDAKERKRKSAMGILPERPIQSIPQPSYSTPISNPLPEIPVPASSTSATLQRMTGRRVA